MPGELEKCSPLGEYLTSCKTKNGKQFIMFWLHPNIFTLPKNCMFYLSEFISDGFRGGIPILKSKFKSRSKKKFMLKCLWNKLLTFQHLDVLNYYWDSEFRRFVVEKLGALKITQRLKIEIEYMFRQSPTSPNKQHAHSIFWIKYIRLTIFITLAQHGLSSKIPQFPHWKKENFGDVPHFGAGITSFF